MPKYAVKVREVEAFALDDGRYLLATTPPQFVSSESFLEAFELVEAHRNGGRPKGGKRAAKTKPVRRQSRKAAAAGDEDPKKAEAQRMYEKEGLKLAEIERRTKVPYSKLWYWSKKWKAPTRAKVAAKEEEIDESWMS